MNIRLAIENGHQAIRRAVLLAWHHKILFLYATLFYVFMVFDQYRQLVHVPTGIVGLSINSVIIALWAIGSTMIAAAFCKKVLAIQDKKLSFGKSFAFGSQIVAIVLWALLEGAWQKAIEFLANKSLISLVITAPLNIIFMLAMTYVVIVLVDSQQGLYFALRRSIELARRSWQVLLWIFIEMAVFMGILVGGLSVGAFFVSEAIGNHVLLLVAPMITSVGWLIIQSANIVVYQALLIEEQREILNQIPPYDF